MPRAALAAQPMVMFAMLATLEEVRYARAELEHAAEASRSAGLRVSSKVHIGIMVEIPAV